ncbi:MAG: tetratricopeptide repeat protein [Planctomycetes bacterium]|nr:tetratricopeptide repeat protein [Planctomycetota bacterium]
MSKIKIYVFFAVFALTFLVSSASGALAQDGSTLDTIYFWNRPPQADGNVTSETFKKVGYSIPGANDAQGNPRPARSTEFDGFEIKNILYGKAPSELRSAQSAWRSRDSRITASSWSERNFDAVVSQLSGKVEGWEGSVSPHVHATALFFLGTAQTETGDFNGAVTTLENLLAKYPETRHYFEASASLATAYAQQKNAESVAALSEKVRTVYTEWKLFVIVVDQEQTRKNQAAVNFIYNQFQGRLASAYFAGEMFTQAQQIYDNQITTLEGDRNISGANQVRLDAANAFIDAGQYSTGRAYLQARYLQPIEGAQDNGFDDRIALYRGQSEFYGEALLLLGDSYVKQAESGLSEGQVWYGPNGDPSAVQGQYYRDAMPYYVKATTFVNFSSHPSRRGDALYKLARCYIMIAEAEHASTRGQVDETAGPGPYEFFALQADYVTSEIKQTYAGSSADSAIRKLYEEIGRPLP